MKPNFKCPKCKKGIVVGKRLHGSYTCPNCHYTMVLTKEDLIRGTKPYRGWFKVETETYRKPFNKKFSRPFKQNQEKIS